MSHPTMEVTTRADLEKLLTEAASTGGPTTFTVKYDTTSWEEGDSTCTEKSSSEPDKCMADDEKRPDLPDFSEFPNFFFAIVCLKEFFILVSIITGIIAPSLLLFGNEESRHKVTRPLYTICQGSLIILWFLHFWFLFLIKRMDESTVKKVEKGHIRARNRSFRVLVRTSTLLVFAIWFFRTTQNVIGGTVIDNNLTDASYGNMMFLWFFSLVLSVFVPLIIAK